MTDDTTDTQAITVTYTATLRYEPWEVDEYDVTEQAAVENLLDGVCREPGNYGDISVDRGD